MLTEDDVNKLTIALAKQSPANIDEKTRIGLGHVLIIVACVASVVFTIAVYKAKFDSCITMDFMREYSRESEELNFHFHAPDTKKVLENQ